MDDARTEHASAQARNSACSQEQHGGTESGPHVRSAEHAAIRASRLRGRWRSTLCGPGVQQRPDRTPCCRRRARTAPQPSHLAHVVCSAHSIVGCSHSRSFTPHRFSRPRAATTTGSWASATPQAAPGVRRRRGGAASIAAAPGTRHDSCIGLSTSTAPGWEGLTSPA